MDSFHTIMEDHLKIDHVALAVRSIEQASVFWGALGLDVLPREKIASEGVFTAMIPIGDSRIELLEPLEDHTPVGRFLLKRGEGLHHVALRVSDIRKTFEDMKQADVKLASGQIQIGSEGHLYFFVHPSSAAGMLLEICQDPPTHV